MGLAYDFSKIVTLPPVEQELKMALPSSFRQVLIGLAADLEFRWFLPDKMVLPETLRSIFSGGCSWSLSLKWTP
jgi:hypothetical protein